MVNRDFTTKVIVKNTTDEVYKAINNVRSWWSEEIEGPTDIEGGIFDYHYEDVHRCKINVEELIPGKRVVWKILENYFSFTKDKQEWIGNEICFEIEDVSGETIITFTQKGLVPEYECYDICQNAWTTYLHNSLKALITEGKGAPNKKTNPKADFSTIILVDQSPLEAYNAINNVRAWWQGEIQGNTDKQGESFTYRMGDVHFSKQKVNELLPGQKVEWIVEESLLSFTEAKDEWTGTKIIFEISEINNKTQVKFIHQGLMPSLECYGGCSNAWTDLIQESLYSLITTGKGKEVF